MIFRFIRQNIVKNIVTYIMVAMFFSCAKKTEEIKNLYQENENIPLSETKNFKLTYSLSGNRIILVTAPLMLDFTNQKQIAYQYFPKTIHIEVINEHNKKTTITADKAYIYKNPNLAELIGNVKIIDSDGSRLETSHLYWDAVYQHIFGDEKTVLQQKGEQITGIGFDSSMDFKNVRINQIKGVIKTNTEK